MIRDRIVDLRRVKASDLLPDPRNWRRHPKAQAAALRGILAEVGYADALLARETPEGLMLIDGHLRAETTPDEMVPVLVLDVDESEAALILGTLDPLAAMAVTGQDSLAALMEGMSSSYLDLINAVSGDLEVVGAGLDQDTARTTNNMQMIGKGSRVGLQCGDLMVTISQDSYDRLWEFVSQPHFESRAAGVEQVIGVGTIA